MFLENVRAYHAQPPLQLLRKILHSKKLNFQKGHFTEHAIAQLADQNSYFENENYTLMVLIDLSKGL